MKRNIYFSVICLLLTCLFAACSGEDSPKQSILFSINNINVNAVNNQTGSNTSLTVGDTLGVFLEGPASEKATTNTDLLLNSYVAYTSSGWTMQQALTFNESQTGGNMNLCVYYPYNSSYDSKSVRFTVNADQNIDSSLKSSDFLFSTQECTIGTNPTISLNHLMTRIVVNIEYASSDIKPYSSVRFKARPTCNISLVNGSVMAESSYTVIEGNTSQSASSATSQQVVFIIPPQTLTSNTPIEFVYDNKSFTTKISQVVEGGNQYTLNYTSYGEDNITYNGIEVEAWNQVTVSQGSLSNDDNYGPDYVTGDVIVYQKTRDTKPVTIVVTGDGYTADDMARGGKFETDAREALDMYFSVEPYKTYKSYFNVYIIPAVSNESGATNTSTGVTRDTYFGAKWGDDYSDMNVSSPTKLFTFVQTYCPDLKQGKTTVDNTGIYLLVNEQRYGGITSSYSNGRNYAIIPTMSGNFRWSSDDPENQYYVGNWTNVFMHECGGHAFGRLLDEYSYSGTYPYETVSGHNWSVPLGLNLTTDYNNTNGTVYWKGYLNNSNYPRVGFYEGGASYSKGVWRSEVISGMCDNRPYFNLISRQLIVERIMKIAGETFSLEDFLKKDVNIDPVRDKNTSSAQRQENINYVEKIYPPLPSPRMIE
jgi:hypothetical protein